MARYRRSWRYRWVRLISVGMTSARRRPTRHTATGHFLLQAASYYHPGRSTNPPLRRRKEREHRGQARWLQVTQDNRDRPTPPALHEDDENLVFQLKNMVEVYAGNPVPLTHTGGELRRRESN